MFSAEPLHVRDIICYLLIGTRLPDWLEFKHSALCHHVFFLGFAGIDSSYYNIFKDSFSTFKSLRNGFPVIVLAHERGGALLPAIDTVLGVASHSSFNYKSFDEMCISTNDQYDNGYPVEPNEGIRHFNRPLRCSQYNMNPLSEEELSHFKKLPKLSEGSHSLIAIDCEMITTTEGDELVRLSCVDSSGEIIIDEYFTPIGHVIDFHTQFSGITQEILDSKATVKSLDAVELLSKFADSRTIIVGHSLENDLRAMKLIHKRVIDTSLIYCSDSKFPHKPGLARLYAKYIKKPFRVGNAAHDSVEDARAALELAQYALSSSAESSDVYLPKMFEQILESISSINVFTTKTHCPYAGTNGKINCILGENDSDVSAKLIDSLENDPPRLTCAFFNGLCECAPKSDDEKIAIDEYDKILKNFLEKVPNNSAIIIYTGNGNLERLKCCVNHSAELVMCRQGLLWIKCT
ncbi:exonuclease family protein [Histomonas meleagridis]|uniref:exonuclease family protein n=1 Tax=Histomonas meleagridis TaxID=135588 RepID=UPI00355A686F|nr:exonuclease family protein [Histomonas meleagridis]KAH0797361.1 exonuclease family protein [Histomonas meleagridis]